MDKNIIPETGQDVKQLREPKEMFSAYVDISGPVFYSTMSDKAKLLYGLLSAMTRAPGYYAFARNSTILRYLHCSERTLQRLFNELQEAGEITIEDDQGGRKTIRKIRVTRLQPFNPDTRDGVNPDTRDGVTNNSINNTNKRKEKAPKGPPPSETEILQWFDRWAVDLGESQEATTALIGDLHAFFEMRKAKKRPILTINAAGRHAKKLLAYSEDYPDFRIEAMRYILGESIDHNWEKLYPITDQKQDDFFRWLRDNGQEIAPPTMQGRGWD